MITIVIADNNSNVRDNMRALLEMESDFRIVGEAKDGLEALSLAEDLKPNILVVDLAIGSINGIEIIKEVGSRSPNTNVVIFSMYDDTPYVVESLREGAKAYVIKDSIAGGLVEAIRNVATSHH